MSDELAEFDGIKPKVSLEDGEEREVKSSSSKSSYKVKRTFDHFYCSCPAWRNQSKAPVNARTCKHLRSLLGDEYEDARVKARNPEADPSGKGKAKAPAKAAKPTSKRTRRTKAEEDGDEEDEEEEKPAPKRARRTKTEEEEDKPKAKKPPSSRRSSTRRKKADSDSEREVKPIPKRARKPASKVEPIKEEDVEMGEPVESTDAPPPQEQAPSADADMDQDDLAEINGIKPKVYLRDGEETEVKSQSSSSTYKVKRTWDHYYCTCPAWRNQGGVPVNARTCKHLKTLLGEDYENARIKLRNPDGPAPPSSKAKPGSTKSSNKDKAKNVELLLANKWDIDSGPDPTGWWMSEKLDGVRTFYDGKNMYSRLGNPFTPPQWFLDKLPTDVTLDGELFGGRGEFQSTVSIVKTVNSPHWKGITFQVFDIPSHASKPFEDRLALLQEMFGPGGKYESKEVVVVEHIEAGDRKHVLRRLKEIESLGGEGLMLRKPGSAYEPTRSSTLLKIKSFYDAEAEVTGYEAGKGKHKGATGSLKCKMESGKTFNVGTGLSDKQRKNPPKIGTIIVYRFQELTKDGVPRFPSFIGEAVDKDKPKDAEIPEHRKKAMMGVKGEEAD